MTPQTATDRWQVEGGQDPQLRHLAPTTPSDYAFDGFIAWCETTTGRAAVLAEARPALRTELEQRWARMAARRPIYRDIHNHNRERTAS